MEQLPFSQNLRQGKTEKEYTLSAMTMTGAMKIPSDNPTKLFRHGKFIVIHGTGRAGVAQNDLCISIPTDDHLRKPRLYPDKEGWILSRYDSTVNRKWFILKYRASSNSLDFNCLKASSLFPSKQKNK
jgi:hypothetical protein